MPTQGTAGADRVQRSAVLPVAEVVALVREWVALQAIHLPDFAGAYLWGGITALPPDAPFPLYRDVDVAVILSQGAQDDNLEVLHRGAMLEVNFQNLSDHQDAEAVLADPSRGPNVATTQILADPTGTLVPLQQAVAAAYPQRRWVRARCEAEKASALEHLTALRQAPNPIAGLDSIWLLLNALSGLVAVARLERPTTRRTLALLRALLDEQGRSDLYQMALTLWGAADLSAAAVQAMLDQTAVAFDRSVEVYQTPTPFGFTIRAHLRPYLTEATQEMIDEGNHREATFWLMALASESYLVLHQDAPDAEKPSFAAELRAMHDVLGYTSVAAWPARVALAGRLTEAIFALADELAARHPE